VCSKFKRLSEDDKIWKEICQISLPDTYLRGSLSWKEQCRLYYEGEQDLSLFPNITLKGWRKSNTNRQPDEILKILLVGDSNCSKSSTLLRFVNRTYTDKNLSHYGIENKKVTVEVADKIILLNIYGSNASQFHGYYRKIRGLMFFFDITDKSSFDDLPLWRREFEKFCCTDIPSILVGSKSDLENLRVVSKEEAQEYASLNQIPYIEISAKENRNVDLAFAVLVHEILKKKDITETNNQMMFHIPTPIDD